MHDEGKQMVTPSLAANGTSNWPGHDSIPRESCEENKKRSLPMVVSARQRSARDHTQSVCASRLPVKPELASTGRIDTNGETVFSR